MEQQENIRDYERFFGEIYKKHYSELCHYAMRFLRDKADAEEIVQEIIFKLWEQRDLLDSVKSIKSYLYRSVHNRCLNFLKHEIQKEKYVDKAWVELKKIEMDSNEDYHSKELEDKIFAAVNELPDRCREVFNLSRYEGMKNKDISEQLGISVKAVEANITRALTTLRESLKMYLNVEMAIIFMVFFVHSYRVLSNIYV